MQFSYLVTSGDITVRQFESVSECSEFSDSEGEFRDVINDRATADAIAAAHFDDIFSSTEVQNA